MLPPTILKLNEHFGSILQIAPFNILPNPVFLSENIWIGIITWSPVDFFGHVFAALYFYIVLIIGLWYLRADLYWIYQKKKKGGIKEKKEKIYFSKTQSYFGVLDLSRQN